MRAKYNAHDLDGAVALARIAAPYLHPRISAASPARSATAEDLTAMLDADLDTLKPQS